MDRYAVVGNPIEHSKSPRIHQAFALQCQQELVYEKILLPLDAFEEHVAAFFNNGGCGLNVTVPFKEKAFHFADRLTERAEAAKAVNTLAKMADGGILGDNTDGAGLLWDLQERLQWSLQGKRILILGAGGAVRGILLPLLSAMPASISIANRTMSKALELARHFAPKGKLEALALDQLAEVPAFDLVINGTSASLSGEALLLPDTCLKSDSACYDLVYSDSDTPFMAAARTRGLNKVSDGLGMLVGQAAESFFLWRKCRPDVVAVMRELRPS